MTEFIGKLSIAEAMGDLYGQRVRLITTISGFIGVSGFIAVQLKITGIIVGFKAQIPADKPKCPVYFISLSV